jgi:hypothetical protein
MLVLIVLPGALGACQQELFSNSDTYTQSRIDRYWGRDSAVEARANRAKASEMGFGFPTGMANQ